MGIDDERGPRRTQYPWPVYAGVGVLAIGVILLVIAAFLTFQQYVL